jgi:hypothetical protein
MTDVRAGSCLDQQPRLARGETPRPATRRGALFSASHGRTISTRWPVASWAVASTTSAARARSWFRHRPMMTPSRTKPIGCGRSSSRSSDGAGRSRRERAKCPVWMETESSPRRGKTTRLTHFGHQRPKYTLFDPPRHIPRIELGRLQCRKIVFGGRICSDVSSSD